MTAIVIGLAISGWAIQAAAAEPASFSASGLPSAQMDAQGRVVEDWGTVGVRLTGEGVTDATAAVQALKLDGLVPAAKATADRNTILSAIWLFPPGAPPDLPKVIAGELSEKATRYVQVGGKQD